MNKEILISNVVSGQKLREVQLKTLNHLKNVVLETFGPYGSNTMIIRDNVFTEYSKDGHKVLKGTMYNDPIERSIQDEFTELTRCVVKAIGDGTTSIVVLAALIFERMVKLETTATPYEIIEDFKSCVEEIKEYIRDKGRDITLEDVYNIAHISTNGNDLVASNVQNLYKEYGFDVFIDVSISNSPDHIVKAYDGMTLETGFSDPAYANTTKKTSSIRNPKIYAFIDPIDTEEMAAFLNQILYKNIVEPCDNKQLENVVPTVILAPKISRDLSALIEQLVGWMFNIEAQTQDPTQKPPLLIISNVFQIEQYADITRMCGCPMIRKYIDPKIQAKDIEEGKAPNLETIVNFCGSADLVEADSSKTKFINPLSMFKRDESGNILVDENGVLEHSDIYNSHITYLESELKSAIEAGEDADVTGKLKRRINSFKSNMVDYLVGGLTVTDRDSVRDLVEDAVLNCRSAARNGVGYGANFEGLRASTVLATRHIEKDNISNIFDIIKDAYEELTCVLYRTAYKDDNKVFDLFRQSVLDKDMPFNLKTKEFDGKVLCSIDTDIVILDAIAKILTIMLTANQCLVQTPLHNKYLLNE